MKFEGYIDIKAPRERVVRLFNDPRFLGEYQEGFLGKEVTSGEPQQDGSVSKMRYKYGKNNMELTETIISNQLPDSFEGFYHHKHMDNTMKSIFTELDDNTTRYTYLIHYTRMSWIMPKLMSIFFRGMFRKQGEKWMQNFKRFVENYQDETGND